MKPQISPQLASLLSRSSCVHRYPSGKRCRFPARKTPCSVLTLPTSIRPATRSPTSTSPPTSAPIPSISNPPANQRLPLLPRPAHDRKSHLRPPRLRPRLHRQPRTPYPPRYRPGTQPRRRSNAPPHLRPPRRVRHKRSDQHQQPASKEEALPRSSTTQETHQLERKSRTHRERWRPAGFFPHLDFSEKQACRGLRGWCGVAPCG